MDAGRRHEIPSLETKDYITHRDSSWNISIVVPILWSQLPQYDVKRAGDTYTPNDLHYRRATLSLEYPNLFPWAVSLPVLCSRGKNYYYIPSLSAIQMSLKKQFEIKVLSAAAHRNLSD